MGFALENFVFGFSSSPRWVSPQMLTQFQGWKIFSQLLTFDVGRFGRFFARENFSGGLCYFATSFCLNGAPKCNIKISDRLFGSMDPIED